MLKASSVLMFQRFKPAGILFLLLSMIAAGVLFHFGIDLFSGIIRRLTIPFTTNSDFGLFYCGAFEFFVNHYSPYTACAGRDTLSGFLYPPLSLLYFSFFPYVGGHTAFIINFAISLSLLIYSVILLLRYLKVEQLVVWQKACLWIALLAPSPVFMTLYGGQANLLVLGSFVIAQHLALKKRFWQAAFTLAVGFWLKLYPIVLIALFYVRDQSRGAAWRTIVAAIGLAVVLSIMIPWQLYQEYFLGFLPNLQRFTLPGEAHSLVAQLLYLRNESPTALTDFHSVIIPSTLNVLSKILLVSGILLASIHSRLPGTSRAIEALALLLIVLLTTSPLAWGHHFVLVLPALAVTLIRLAKGGTRIFDSVIIFACWMTFILPSWLSLPFNIDANPVIWGAAHLFYACYLVASLILGGLIIAPHLKDYKLIIKDFLWISVPRSTQQLLVRNKLIFRRRQRV